MITQLDFLRGTLSFVVGLRVSAIDLFEPNSRNGAPTSSQASKVVPLDAPDHGQAHSGLRRDPQMCELRKPTERSHRVPIKLLWHPEGPKPSEGTKARIL